MRFFGRRFYLGALFVLVSALMLRGGVRLQTIKRRWGIPIATLRRWRQWWREAFPATELWRAKVIMHGCMEIEFARLFGGPGWAGVNTKIIVKKFRMFLMTLFLLGNL